MTTKGEQLASLAKEKDEALTHYKKLNEEKVAFEGLVEDLQTAIGEHYEAGFQFAVAQARVVLSESEV
ncbi:hypothetical protein A2U01_0116573, partial [Trifolium medium]|nr:hypothetical protein [Trifolium medium]